MKLRPLLIICATAVVIGGGVAVFAVSSSQINAPERSSEASRVLGLEYYVPNQFQKAVQLADKLPEANLTSSIRGGIFPHDLLHGEYVAHLLKLLQKQKPKNILLVGPNHYERGASNMLTAEADWTTPFGFVRANRSVIAQLAKQSVVVVDNGVVQHEHAINGILPYLAYYLPETEIIPLILKSEVILRDIEYLLPVLDTVLPADTVIIAAVDFSHYLNSQQAQVNDQVTARALEAFDYKAILSFGIRFNDYVDSPPSIALLLAWAKRHSFGNVEILFNTNSGLLANDFTQPVTSYFEVVYY